MADDSKEALDDLLKYLREKGARGVAEEIAKVIARGVTEEAEGKGRVKELTQRPLNSEEAYRVAVEILIASLEPSIMKMHALKEIEGLAKMQASIIWQQDFVEKSPISIEDYEDISIPDSNGVEKLEEDLSKLVALMGQV